LTEATPRTRLPGSFHLSRLVACLTLTS
jgi:hypothetical protein